MGTSALHVGLTALCPHGGTVSVVASSPRVRLSGQPAATAADTWTVAGCVFTVGNKPQPCTSVRWMVPSARVRIGGNPAVLQGSTGLCFSADQIPAGPPNIVVVQPRVSAQ